MGHSNAPRDANLPPGYDEEEPYENTDIASFPEWWRQNIEEFQRYGLRPYRPPRFLDGEITTEVIREMEGEVGVDIRLRTTDPGIDHDWDVWVDEESISQIDKRRDGDAYSEFGMESEEFRELVRSHVIGES